MPDRPQPLEVASFIVFEAERQDADALLALAIAKAESDFVNQCNKNGCRYGIGPFQIIRSTFFKNCEGDVFDASDNIKCGIKLLKEDGPKHWIPWSLRTWYPIYVAAVLENSRRKLAALGL